MAEIIRLRSSPHDEVQQLLPWFANRTLGDAEREQVEAHLAQCAECRAELAAERQLAAAIESSAASDTGPSWERMKQKLEAAGKPDFRPAAPFWMRRVPLAWAIAGPMAAAAAIAILFVNLPATPSPQPQYHALGTADISRPANLVVQFQSSSRVSDMQQALQSADARLISGPTPTGAYLLYVDPPRRQLALKQLRDSQAVSLAQPIDAPVGE